MPRLPSDVWRHFTPAVKDGKDAYMCNYCAQTYSKNATKMQQHLTKCKKFSQSSQESSASHGNSSASIPCMPFSPSATSSTLGELFIDTMDDRSQQYADECLARALYATGSPLMLIDNVYWRRFFSIFHPAYTPPTRLALSTHLLDAEFNRVQGKVRETIEKAECVAVISDGWSNTRGEGMISYIVATPLPVFFKSTDTKGNVYTSSYIANELKAVINELGPNKVVAVVTDNAANMKAAWAQVEETFPHITPIGCMSHGLNLLLNDIMGLRSMETLYKRAKQVVKYVKDTQVVAATYSYKQKAKKKNTILELQDIARSSRVVIMYNSLLEGKDSLQEMAVSQSLNVETSIRETLLDDGFWERVVSSLKLLSPVTSAIEQIEGDDAALSDVLMLFVVLQDKISIALPTSMLLQADEKAVVESMERCQEFCVKPIHAAAYILDPKHVGKQMLSGEQINSAYYVISTLSRHLSLEEGKVLGSLAKFSTKQGLWRVDGIWESCQHISAATWWKGLCASEPLSPVASMILQIPPTSSVTECNRSHFSTTEMCNDLASDRVQKWVAVQANLKHFEPSKEECAYMDRDKGGPMKVSSQSESQEKEYGHI